MTGSVEPPSPDAPAAAARVQAIPKHKPRLALFIATAAGLGYLPKAPGTWGSLLGVLIYALTEHFYPYHRFSIAVHWVEVPLLTHALWNAGTVLPLALFIAVIGVWASSRVSHFSGQKDPQFVVIDEVSGQLFTYLFAVTVANWKYLLLGLILFRVFDIWKPFPARQAESLPGGWGIMTDDWVAGVYAAIGLWIARAAGL
jgi:phosphatidylglycerophosphatase A